MGCRREVLEGPDPVPKRLVVLEFQSYDRAKEWWDSEGYQQARAVRYDCATAKICLIDGRDDRPT